ncbi:MAG: outer membrane beta-barrel protein [Holosporales bacterium]
MSTKKIALSVCSMLFFVAASQRALAAPIILSDVNIRPLHQFVPGTEIVTARNTPDGIEVSEGFKITPFFNQSVGYNSNVFATQSNTEDGFSLSSVGTLMDFQQNALSFNGSVEGEIYNYFRSTSENQNNLAARGVLGYDSGDLGNFQLELRHISAHDLRGDPDNDAGSVEPIGYTLDSAKLIYTKKIADFTTSLSAGLVGTEYDDTLSNSNTFINNSDRDYEREQYEASVSYDVNSDLSFYGRGIFTVFDYSQALDDSGFNRDSTGNRFEVGSVYAITPLLNVDAFVGLQERDYDDARLKDIDNVVFGTQVNWSVTSLVNVRFFVERYLLETISPLVSGVVADRAGIRFDHEILPHWVWSGQFTRQWENFEGTSRDDVLDFAGIQSAYYLSQGFSITMQIQRVIRDTATLPSRYDQNTALVGLRFAY